MISITYGNNTFVDNIWNLGDNPDLKSVPSLIFEKEIVHEDTTIYNYLVNYSLGYAFFDKDKIVSRPGLGSSFDIIVGKNVLGIAFTNRATCRVIKLDGFYTGKHKLGELFPNRIVLSEASLITGKLPNGWLNIGPYLVETYESSNDVFNFCDYFEMEKGSPKAYYNLSGEAFGYAYYPSTKQAYFKYLARRPYDYYVEGPKISVTKNDFTSKITQRLRNALKNGTSINVSDLKEIQEGDSIFDSLIPEMSFAYKIKGAIPQFCDGTNKDIAFSHYAYFTDSLMELSERLTELCTKGNFLMATHIIPNDPQLTTALDRYRSNLAQWLNEAFSAYEASWKSDVKQINDLCKQVVDIDIGGIKIDSFAEKTLLPPAISESIPLKIPVDCGGFSCPVKVDGTNMTIENAAQFDFLFDENRQRDVSRTNALIKDFVRWSLVDSASGMKSKYLDAVNNSSLMRDYTVGTYRSWHDGLFKDRTWYRAKKVLHSSGNPAETIYAFSTPDSTTFTGQLVSLKDVYVNNRENDLNVNFLISADLADMPFSFVECKGASIDAYIAVLDKVKQDLLNYGVSMAFWYKGQGNLGTSNKISMGIQTETRKINRDGKLCKKKTSNLVKGLSDPYVYTGSALFDITISFNIQKNLSHENLLGYIADNYDPIAMDVISNDRKQITTSVAQKAVGQLIYELKEVACLEDLRSFFKIMGVPCPSSTVAYFSMNKPDLGPGILESVMSPDTSVIDSVIQQLTDERKACFQEQNTQSNVFLSAIDDNFISNLRTVCDSMKSRVEGPKVSQPKCFFVGSRTGVPTQEAINVGGVALHVF